MTAAAVSNQADAPPMGRLPGVLLGLGLGGFVDGIVIHQLLQWHHMVSDTHDHPMNTVHGLEVNTVADGLFHAGTWVLVVAGLFALVHQWRDGRRAPSWRVHIGLLVFGWGAFNVVEGIVDHMILGVHHVRDDLGGPRSWDIGFLVLGLAMAAVGWFVSRSGDARGRIRAT